MIPKDSGFNQSTTSCALIRPVARIWKEGVHCLVSADRRISVCDPHFLAGGLGAP